MESIERERDRERILCKSRLLVHLQDGGEEQYIPKDQLASVRDLSDFGTGSSKVASLQITDFTRPSKKTLMD